MRQHKKAWTRVQLEMSVMGRNRSISFNAAVPFSLETQSSGRLEDHVVAVS